MATDDSNHETQENQTTASKTDSTELQKIVEGDFTPTDFTVTPAMRTESS